MHHDYFTLRMTGTCGNAVTRAEALSVLCEERSAAAIRHLYAPGLLHCVRNDERKERRRKGGNAIARAEALPVIARSAATWQSGTCMRLDCFTAFAMTKGKNAIAKVGTLSQRRTLPSSLRTRRVKQSRCMKLPSCHVAMLLIMKGCVSVCKRRRGKAGNVHRR
jgi:hypothetical protein